MQPTTRLRLTALERRDVPAVFVIPDGDIAALAAAITACNTNNQADTIRLATAGTYTFAAVADAADGGNALPSVLRDTADANTVTFEGNGSVFRRSTAIGTPAFRFLRVGVLGNPVRVTLTNLRLTNGESTADGGAVLVNAGDLIVRECTFDNNRAQSGGAIYASTLGSTTRSVVATDTNFTQNTAATTTTGGGGAIFVQGSSALYVGTSTFTNNNSNRDGGAVRFSATTATATFYVTTFFGNTSAGGTGGGAVFAQGSASFLECSVRDNLSDASGDGIFSIGGSLTLTRTTVSGNQATRSTGSGGGVFCQGTFDAINSTIHGNRCGNGGGLALSVTGANTATLQHSTVTANRAFRPGAANGGGINVTFGTLSLGHTVVAGNVLETGGDGPDVNGSVTSLGYNLIQNTAGTIITGTTTGNLTGIDPQLGPLLDNGGPTATRLPAIVSPLVNAGNMSFVPPPSIDQRGFSRLFENRIDIGAIEARPGPIVTGVVVNAGAAQRSRVTAVTVNFNFLVGFAGSIASAFTVSRIGGGAVGGFTATAADAGGFTAATLSGFTGAETEFGSLADGRYTLTVLASQVSTDGRPLDGDGNGVGGDNYVLTGTVANGLFRLFGDANGDGSVSGGDFGLFRLAFGTSVGDPNYLAYFDFDGNGSVSGTDFGNFRVRFGTTVP